MLTDITAKAQEHGCDTCLSSFLGTRLTYMCLCTGQTVKVHVSVKNIVEGAARGRFHGILLLCPATVKVHLPAERIITWINYMQVPAGRFSAAGRRWSAEGATSCLPHQHLKNIWLGLQQPGS